MVVDLRFQKALVTGGAGFIGSHICEKLVNMGIEVISLDDYSAGKEENLDGLACEKVNGDILDEVLVDKLMKGVDVIFHNAASKKAVCLKDPKRDLDVNGKGTLVLLQAAVKNKVRKFVHASTGSVYGEPIFFPQDEDHPLNPTSYYGVSKLAGERYVKMFSSLYGLDVSILRYFHVYGPKQVWADNVGGVVAIFIRRMIEKKPITIFGDGTQQRSFTYVEDVVEANLSAATVDKAVGQAYNCASGLQVSVGDLVGVISNAFGLDGYPVVYEDWTPGDIKIFDIDNSKIKSDLGITFMTDLARGIRYTIDWAECHFRSVRKKGCA